MSDADRLRRSRIRMLVPALGLGLFVLVAALVLMVGRPSEKPEPLADVRTVTLVPSIEDELLQLDEDELLQLREALLQAPAIDQYGPLEVRPVLLVERREPGALCAFARWLQRSEGALARLGGDLARSACDES